MANPQTQWRPRNDIAIFVRTLHLLDLDLLPDFPGITESTFGSSTSTSVTAAAVRTISSHSQPQNLQSRIKAVEWSLYRLFEVYDVEATRAKLAGFFPPSAPIQSLNLRTAIYKWLTELKRDGVLPRETVLRKTMLDECKGEKFEELLAAFAMVVLRKRLARKSGRVKGIQALAMMEAKTRQMSDRETTVALILAHRVSLRQSLQRRQHLQSEAHTQIQSLGVLRDNISRRLEIASQPENIEELSTPQYETLKDQVNQAFAADRQWAAYILEGNPAATSLPVTTAEAVQQLFASPARLASNDKSLFEETSGNPQVNQAMIELQQSVLDHQARAQRLSRLRESLLDETHQLPPQPSSTGTPGSEQARPPLWKTAQKESSNGPRFNRHQALTLASLPV
ncbi:hypothetical protein A1O1_03500 [Capronia coronata CBS 617.96]|uniref:HAUS augmin-like complex subunit 6 N-terminal domain-containing protein n=1 Tax=Capronia coronata CBS 617.96 TaxID=1182541 RepID=W9Z7C8_9EURO|nr:uncharacterized protein A1O1_03500 [Capronia coronata CBS 617.96]EXJ90399.1 hypothetical protein A1O1_03500 [Capronia coronata CBS 617.96]